MVANETNKFAPNLKNTFQPTKYLGYLLAHSLKGFSSKLLENFSEAGYPISRVHWLILAKTFHFSNEILLQSDVVEMMMGDKTQVTRAVDDLVKKGWLTQQIDKKDRRNRVLQITNEGRCVVPELMKCVDKTTEELTGNINKKDLEITKQVMAKIIENTQNSNQ